MNDTYHTNDLLTTRKEKEKDAERRIWTESHCQKIKGKERNIYEHLMK